MDSPNFHHQFSDPSPIVQLLNRGDQLTQQFQKLFNESLNHVQTLRSSHLQHSNLSKLASRASPSKNMPRSPSSSFSSIRERTLSALATTGEEALASIRESLRCLESTVDQLGELLYHVDVYLSEPKTDGSLGFDPFNALKHLSQLFSAYQAELLAKRELFASLNCEEIDMDTFAQQWRICDEIQSLTKETMSDLADAIGAWST